MTAGMADIIAAHAYSHNTVEDHPEYGYTDAAVCFCGARLYLETLGEPNDRDDLHAAHVADELTKAGFGNIPDALREAANEWIAGEWAAAFIAVENDAIVSQASANWLRQRARLIEKAAFNIAAAADPEGHALVKAIRDRKAEA